MRQRNRLLALMVVPWVALGLWAQSEQGAPPAGEPQTVAVAEHSSRWDYPRTTTQGPGQQVHVVAKGDTLWDLGAKYLGDPFAWPQIWELNKWIKDPHWIYPGDPILVEKGRATVTQSRDQNLAPGEVADLQPETTLVKRRTMDEYAFSFQDFILMPFLVPTTAENYFRQVGAFKIIGQEDARKNMMADGDIAFIGGGSAQGLKVGDRLVVTTVAARHFYNPADRNHRFLLGDILEHEGIVRVTQVYPSQSVAIIERSLDGISQGDYVVPFVEPPAILNTLRTDIGSPIHIKQPVAKILFIRQDKPVASGGDMVIVDRGSRDGFNVGDILLSARTQLLDEANPAAKDTTNYYLGQLMIIQAGDRFATCRVLRSKEELLIGDILTH